MVEVEDQLPDGLHDALLRGLTVDYVAGVLMLDLDVWIGEMDDEARREMYRRGRITVTGLCFLVIDSPDARSSPVVGDLMIDGDEGEPHTAIVPLPAIEPGCFLYWIFVHKWNGFIRFAARGASLEWTGPEHTTA